MKESDHRLLREAFSYALEAHGAQTRKGTEIPYASHLLQVAGLVLEAGGDLAEASAALLHDSLEDCERVDAAALRERFGPELSALVESCTDLLPGDAPGEKSAWAVRKTHFLARIARADPRAQRIAACDKLHNLRSLVADLRAEGPATLERFRATPGQTRWYFESAHGLLRDALPAPLALEFDAALESLRDFVPRSEPPGREETS